MRFGDPGRDCPQENCADHGDPGKNVQVMCHRAPKALQKLGALLRGSGKGDVKHIAFSHVDAAFA